MKLPTISTDKGHLHRASIHGFTLIEVLIVMTLVAMVGGLGFYFSLDNFRGYSFRSDRDTLISGLQHARAEAMANICRGTSGACTSGTGEPHGVKILSDKFVIFQGTSYASANHDFDAILPYNSTNTLSGDDEVVFLQLSGNIDTIKNITIKDQSIHTSTVTISTEGQIIWTN